MSIAELQKKVSKHPRSSNYRRDLAERLLVDGRFVDALEQAQVGLDLQDSELSPVAVELEELERNILESHLDALVGPAFEFVIDNHLPRVENGRVVELTIHLEGGDLRRLEEIFTSPLLSDLDVLGVIVDDIVEDVFGKLSAAPISVAELNLWLRGRVAPANLRGLLTAPICRGLESLYLRASTLTDDTAKAISHAATSLSELVLRSDDMKALGPDAVNFIADGRFASNLHTLGIISSSIGDPGAFNLASSASFKGLRRLLLRDGVISNDGARILASDPIFVDLAYLDVSRNAIDDAGLVALAGLDVEIRSDGQHPAR